MRRSYPSTRRECSESTSITALKKPFLITKGTHLPWQVLQEKFSQIVGEYHKSFPLRSGTTRKYVQALLEHLDVIGVTVREGEARKLKG